MKCSMWVCYKIGSSQCIIDSKFGHSNSFSFGVVSLEQIQVVSFPDGADTQGHVTAFFKLKIKSLSVFRKMGFHCLFILIFAKQQLDHYWSENSVFAVDWLFFVGILPLD